MNINNQSPAAVVIELGERLKQARLNINMTQSEVADIAGINRKGVLNAEKDNVKLESLVAIMMALKLTDNINQFLPDQPISPLQLAKLTGKKRQRSSGSSTVNKSPSTW
ncbi:hypothetical protein MNBD_GAMMA07-2196 [hydrothermal vent metagenome]|uniref:HTH cro/C1-type domain-containing protein n=1 Tax=hydrothermal vent metagenome TaxID=652676 RepID=A0A3B0WZ07_9ZZZZ